MEKTISELQGKEVIHDKGLIQLKILINSLHITFATASEYISNFPSLNSSHSELVETCKRLKAEISTRDEEIFSIQGSQNITDSSLKRLIRLIQELSLSFEETVHRILEYENLERKITRLSEVFSEFLARKLIRMARK